MGEIRRWNSWEILQNLSKVYLNSSNMAKSRNSLWKRCPRSQSMSLTDQTEWILKDNLAPFLYEVDVFKWAEIFTTVFSKVLRSLLCISWTTYLLIHFLRQRDRNKKQRREDGFICCFSPQMPAIGRAEWSQESRTQSGSLMWMVRTHIVEPSAVSVQQLMVGSWLGNGVGTGV